jgi:hypothetical protein
MLLHVQLNKSRSTKRKQIHNIATLKMLNDVAYKTKQVNFEYNVNDFDSILPPKTATYVYLSFVNNISYVSCSFRQQLFVLVQQKFAIILVSQQF